MPVKPPGRALVALVEQGVPRRGVDDVAHRSRASASTSSWCSATPSATLICSEQIDRARLIGLLRRLDMPLARIGGVLKLSGADAAREVAAFWAEAEADIGAKRRLVAYLERHLEGRGEPMYDVETRDVPEQHVATMQRNLTVGDLPAFIEEGWTRLGAVLRDAGAATDGPFLVIYHGEVNDDSDGPVELCLPFRGSVEPPDGSVAVRTEPAHREAFTTLTRAQIEFPSILDAYGAVERWMEREGHEMTASPREVYFTDADVAADQPFCDVAYPMR